MKLSIGLITLGLPFDGKTIEEKSLGGSETAMFYMGKELAKRGHTVRIFCQCPRPGTYDGVEYLDISSLKSLAGILEFDVMIVSRWLSFLPKHNFKARSVYVWLHDMPTMTKDQFMCASYKVDNFFVMSEFQQKVYSEFADEIGDRFLLTKNGIDLELIEESIKGVERKKNRYVYASRPERGLEYLLKEIWPALYHADNESELYISSYDIFAVAGSAPPQTTAIWQECKKMQEALPNVKDMGSLLKPDYYKLLASCRAMLYPTNFPEISCINSMETMLCGAPLISTADFALTETAKRGAILLDETWGTPDYTRAFVFKALSLSQNDVEHKRLQTEGRKWVRDNYQWKDVALQWEQTFMDFFQKRSRSNPVGVLKELIRNDDYVAAKKLVTESEFKCEKDLFPSEMVEEIDSVLACAQTPQEKENVRESGFINPQTDKPIARFQAILDALTNYVRAERPKKAVRVLDIGCLHGGLIREVVSHLESMNVECAATGIDFNKEALEIAKKNTDDESIEYKEHTFGVDNESVLGKFDVVIAGEIMEHVLDTQDFLKRVRRLVVREGLVCLTFPQGCWKPLISEHDFEIDPTKRGHVHHFEQMDLYSLFEGQKNFEHAYHPCGMNYAGELCGNWMVFFRAGNDKFGEVDYKKKFLVTRPWQTISACMIVRDAEDELSKCLKSFRQVVDELIIVDTGSVDETIRIAKKFTDNVQEIEWPEDFSAARNHSIKDAKGDWVLWIDSDEVLVDSERVRKYVLSSIYNGYVIRQNHLMLDFQSKPDVPIRLFRNHQGYKFYGVIHEHCEAEMDVSIQPAVVLDDVDIAHYGYLNEHRRRIKCSARNLALLAKDRKINPERKLGVVLVMRDYINLANWDIEAAGGKLTKDSVKWLRSCIGLYRSKIDKEHRVHRLAEPIYQTALETLGKHGVSITEEETAPPFEGALVLAASYGGLEFPEGTAATPERMWFSSVEEHDAYIQDKCKRLGDEMDEKLYRKPF